MISYKLGEQLSSGQRVEVNIPLIETSWTSNENSLIDQTQFQSKCSLKNLKLILHSVKKIFVVVCYIVVVMYSRLWKFLNPCVHNKMNTFQKMNSFNMGKFCSFLLCLKRYSSLSPQKKHNSIGCIHNNTYSQVFSFFRNFTGFSDTLFQLGYNLHIIICYHIHFCISCWTGYGVIQ